MTKAMTGVYLGIDYGAKRIGLARSDPGARIASPIRTLTVKSRNDAIARIAKVIQENEPVGLVIGYPISMSGEPSAKSQQVDRFVELLIDVFDGPIYKVDERLTSVEATRVVHAHGQKSGKDKGRLDRIAAVLILQHFLDSMPRGES